MQKNHCEKLHFRNTFRMSHPKKITRDVAMIHDSITLIHLGATDTAVGFRRRLQLLSFQFQMVVFLLLKVGPRQPVSQSTHQTLNTILHVIK